MGCVVDCIDGDRKITSGCIEDSGCIVSQSDAVPIGGGSINRQGAIDQIRDVLANDGVAAISTNFGRDGDFISGRISNRESNKLTRRYVSRGAGNVDGFGRVVDCIDGNRQITCRGIEGGRRIVSQSLAITIGS